MSRKSPLKRKRTSSARRKYKEYSGENRRPGEKPKNFKGAVSRFTPLLKPFVPGLTVVLIAGVIGTVLTVTGRLLSRSLTVRVTMKPPAPVLSSAPPK